MDLTLQAHAHKQARTTLRVGLWGMVLGGHWARHLSSALSYTRTLDPKPCQWLTAVRYWAFPSKTMAFMPFHLPFVPLQRFGRQSARGTQQAEIAMLTLCMLCPWEVPSVASKTARQPAIPFTKKEGVRGCGGWRGCFRWDLRTTVKCCTVYFIGIVLHSLLLLPWILHSQIKPKTEMRFSSHISFCPLNSRGGWDKADFPKCLRKASRRQEASNTRKIRPSRPAPGDG